jgi:hypothetical protein
VFSSPVIVRVIKGYDGLSMQDANKKCIQAMDWKISSKENTLET